MYLREPQNAIQEYNILNLIAGMYCYFGGFSILNVAIHGSYCIDLGLCKSLEKVYEGNACALLLLKFPNILPPYSSHIV